MTALLKAAGSTLCNLFSSAGPASPVPSPLTVAARQTPLTGTIRLDPIPNFHDLGIADNPAAIREELRRGPSVCFNVGPEGIPFAVPARLLQYHSPWFGHAFATAALPATVPIPLHEHPSAAFAKLVTWLQEGRLGDEHAALITPAAATFSADLLGDSDSESSSAEAEEAENEGTILRTAQKACTLLCDIHYLADDFDMEALQTEAQEEIQRIADRCAEMGHPTPLQPHTIMGVFSRTAVDSPLRDLAMQELRGAFLAHPELYRFEEWKECLEACEGLREVVLEGVLEIIAQSWARSAREEAREGRSPALDEGRPAGYWKGLF